VPEKPKPFSLDQIPDFLGSNYYSYERLRLASADGKIAVRYKNTGSFILLLNEKEAKTFKSTADIVVWDIFYPLIISVHDNDSLQVINIETGACDKYQQEKDLIKKTQTILLNNEKLYCITANSIVSFDKNKLSSTPRHVPLQDNKDDKTRVIINTKHNFSSLVNSYKLLLANSDVFQVWNLHNEKNEMFMECEGRNQNSTTKFFWCSLRR